MATVSPLGSLPKELQAFLEKINEVIDKPIAEPKQQEQDWLAPGDAYLYIRDGGFVAESVYVYSLSAITLLEEDGITPLDDGAGDPLRVGSIWKGNREEADGDNTAGWTHTFLQVAVKPSTVVLRDSSGAVVAIDDGAGNFVAKATGRPGVAYTITAGGTDIVYTGGGEGFGATPLKFDVDPVTLTVDYVDVAAGNQLDGIVEFNDSPVWLELIDTLGSPAPIPAGTTAGVVNYGIEKTWGELGVAFLLNAVRGIESGDATITDVIADIKGVTAGNWNQLSGAVPFTQLKTLTEDFDLLESSYEAEHILTGGNDGLHKSIRQLDTSNGSLYLLGLFAGRLNVESYTGTYGGYDYLILRLGFNCNDMSYRTYDMKSAPTTVPQNTVAGSGIVATDKSQNQAFFIEVFRDISAGAAQADLDNVSVRLYWYERTDDEFVKAFEYRKRIDGENLLPTIYDFNSLILDEGTDQDAVISNALSLQSWIRNNFVRKLQSTESSYLSAREQAGIPLVFGEQTGAGSKDELWLKLFSGSVHVKKGWLQMSQNTVSSKKLRDGDLLDATDVVAMPGFSLIFDGSGTSEEATYGVNLEAGVMIADVDPPVLGDVRFIIQGTSEPVSTPYIYSAAPGDDDYYYDFWVVEPAAPSLPSTSPLNSWLRDTPAIWLHRLVEKFSFAPGTPAPYVGRSHTEIRNGTPPDEGVDTLFKRTFNGSDPVYECSQLRFAGTAGGGSPYHNPNTTRAAIPGTLELRADDGVNDKLIATDDGAGGWVFDSTVGNDWATALDTPGTLAYTRADQDDALQLALFKGMEFKVGSIPDWKGAGFPGDTPTAGELRLTVVAEKDRLYLSKVHKSTLVRSEYGDSVDPREAWMTYATVENIPEGAIAGVRTITPSDPPHYAANKDSLDTLRGQTIQWLKSDSSEYDEWGDAYEVTATSYYLNFAGSDVHLRFGYAGVGGPVVSPGSYFTDPGEIVNKAYIDQAVLGSVISPVGDKTPVRRIPIRGPAFNPNASATENISIDSSGENIVAIDIVIRDTYGSLVSEAPPYYVQDNSFYSGKRGMLSISPASYKNADVASQQAAEKNFRTNNSLPTGIAFTGRFTGGNVPGVRWHSLLLRETRANLGPNNGHVGDTEDTFFLYPYRTDLFWGDGAGNSRIGGTAFSGSQEFPLHLVLSGNEFIYPVGVTSIHRRLLVGSAGAFFSRVVVGTTEWAHFDGTGTLVPSPGLPGTTSIVGGKINPYTGDIEVPFEFSPVPGSNVYYYVRVSRPRYYPSHNDKVLGRTSPVTDTLIPINNRVESINPSLIMRLFFMDEAMFHVELPMNLLTDAQYPTRVSHRKSFMFAIAQPVNILRNDFNPGYMVCRVAFSCKQTGSVVIADDLDENWNLSAMTFGPPNSLATNKGQVSGGILDTFERHAVQLIDPFDFRYITVSGERNYGVYPPRFCGHEDANGSLLNGVPTGGTYPVANFALKHATHIGDGGAPFSSPAPILDGVLNWYPEYSGHRNDTSLKVNLGDYPSGQTET